MSWKWDGNNDEQPPQQDVPTKSAFRGLFYGILFSAGIIAILVIVYVLVWASN
jgi:hypothetical protein